MGALSSHPAELPRIVMVLGKGGVGRTTVATALGLALAEAGERTLILEWALADPIAGWFGHPQAGAQPATLLPGLAVANYDLDEALRAYFVDHLHAGFFYRRVVHGAAVRRLIDAAPGVAELLFLGQLWWLTTLAEQEAGLVFDRIVVDAPATGHGLGVLGMPATLNLLGATGLLGIEVERVRSMMADPRWLGALIVAEGEEMICQETLQLVAQTTQRLERKPIAVVINRSVSKWIDAAREPSWLSDLTGSLTEGAGRALQGIAAGLQARARRERQLVLDLAGETERGAVTLPEVLAELGPCSSQQVVRALAPAIWVSLVRVA